MKVNKPLARILACVAAAVGFSAASATTATASAAEDTRYTWADNLTLRAAPDAKAEALARLPLGTSVHMLGTDEPLVHREETCRG